MTFDDDNNLKNTKRNIVSNSKKEYSNNSDNLILEDFDEKLYDEVQYLSNALNGGNLNLTSEEESKLKQDLNLILSNIEKQDLENNNSKMIDESHIDLSKPKDVVFDDSIFTKEINDDSSSKGFKENSVVGSDEIDSILEQNDSIFKKTIDFQEFNEGNSTEFVVEGGDGGVSISDSKDSSFEIIPDSQNLVVDDVSDSVVESEEVVVGDVSDSVVENESFSISESNDSQNEVIDDNAHISVDDALNELMDDYSNDVVIKVNNVSMEYKLSQDKIDTLKEFFIRTIKRNKRKTKTITALKNISFEIPKGDRVGIIGFNGAGKSTLLKLLSRVYDPTEGTIETKGKIAPLLELGAGFDNNYSGKANIFLNGAFLGYSEDFIKEKYDEIVEFSELGDAINYHVKTYSSGMRAKLGFSIATIVEPDILIIDEILSVGDIKFRRKSSDKIRSLINSGITVLLVSHSVGQIRELCNKAIWIDNGELKMMGEVNKVCDAYVKAADEASNEQLKNIELN